MDREDFTLSHGVFAVRRSTVFCASHPTLKMRKTVVSGGGGPGQFADFTLRIEPLERGAGIEFESRITGGAIPAESIPAVEQGIRARASAGLLAGAPVTDFRAILLDGKTHPNDSSAFEFLLRTRGRQYAGRGFRMPGVKFRNPALRRRGRARLLSPCA
jgi:translation elongation factor EF-G